MSVPSLPKREKEKGLEKAETKARAKEKVEKAVKREKAKVARRQRENGTIETAADPFLMFRRAGRRHRKLLW